MVKDLSSADSSNIDWIYDETHSHPYGLEATRSTRNERFPICMSVRGHEQNLQVSKRGECAHTDGRVLHEMLHTTR